MKPSKSVVYCLLLVPLHLLGQVDTLTHPASVSPPLKPIDFREIPYTYTTHSTTTVRGHSTTTSSTHTGIRRIYSYDGIDVDDPHTELWRYMDALNDQNVVDQHHQFDDMVASRRQASSIGAAIAIPGFILMLVGAGQAAAYKKALTQQQTAAHTLKTVSTSPPAASGPTLANCSSWLGYGGTWECLSGPYAGQRTNVDPFTVTPAPQPSLPIASAGTSANVDLPNGDGLLVGGTVAMVVGFIVACTSAGDPNAAFLKAVQYYNRGLKQKFSWEMQPLYQYGVTGVRLIGHF